MTKEELKKEVFEIISNRLFIDVSVVENDMDSDYRDLNIDYIDFAETLIDIESKFDISISDAEEMTIKTFSDILNCVYNKIKHE